MNRLSFLLSALFAALAFNAQTADAIFDGGVISIPVGTLIALKAAGLIGLKIGAGAGAFGRRGRFRGRRSAEPSPAANPEPIFDGGVVTIPTALVGLGALKLIFAGGLAKGSLIGRRGKRSADPEPIFDGGVISIPVGTLIALKAAGLIGIKIGAAAASGGRRSRFRGRRAADDMLVEVPVDSEIAAAIASAAVKYDAIAETEISRAKRSAAPIDPVTITLTPAVLALKSVAAIKGVKVIAAALAGNNNRGKRSAEPIFDFGVVSIPLGTALAIKGIAVLGAAKGLAIANSGRHGHLGKRSAEPIFDGGIISIPVGTALALKGIGALGFFKGLALANAGRGGRRHIGKRSAEPLFDGGIITIPLGTAIALKLVGGLGLAKGLALAGGRRGRHFGKRSAEPLFDGGIITIPLGTAIALKIVGGLGLIKGAALANAGRGRRTHFGKRSVDEDELEATLFAAAASDNDDCAKKTICYVNALPESDITEETAPIRQIFGADDELNFNKGTVEFDVAALVGRNGGNAQCETVYSQCPHSLHKLFELAQA